MNHLIFSIATFHRLLNFSTFNLINFVTTNLNLSTAIDFSYVYASIS